jgi:hypothetical protein
LIGSGTDQLGGNLNVDVGPSGLFLLGGATTSEAIGSLQLFRLGSVAGDADTTAGGTLIMNGDIRSRNAGLTTGATPAGTVSGNVNLNGGRNFSAQDSFVIDPAADLIIHAQLSNGSFTANEFGTTMVTNPLNTNNGASVNGQALDFNQSHNFGLAFPTDGTLIPTTAGALGTGNVTINAGGLLLLDNVTYGNQNFITDGATLTVAGGRLELIGSNTGSTEVIGNLTLNAGNNFATRAEIVINSSAGGITELQAAALTRNGQSLTNFIGVGADLGETTNSRIHQQFALYSGHGARPRWVRPGYRRRWERRGSAVLLRPCHHVRQRYQRWRQCDRTARWHGTRSQSRFDCQQHHRRFDPGEWCHGQW